MRFLYTCKQAHQKISENLDRPLNFSERAHLKLHLSLCDACSRFRQQMQLLRHSMQQISDLPAEMDEQTRSGPST
ncbi:zf-HC2 domain-containing protein [Undibacterium griseum]|uniref:Zf-HC2 domain-containing protein n=1 Tax=Undibacterium griseum TaxID=2762295 RepID=A0ABR6YPD6_9BURK|nr:zf-HC2 domain-containing protein [Undibacterium griseum]MBC3885769.1 zf-HC2 domain-containing protein [Undibacterium griseum]